MVQMKLACIILKKMDRSERKTNEFAIKLQQRIDAFREETGASNILPERFDGDMSIDSSDSENVAELESLLHNLNENQISQMEQQCAEYTPANSDNR